MSFQLHERIANAIVGAKKEIINEILRNSFDLINEINLSKILIMASRFKWNDTVEIFLDEKHKFSPANALHGLESAVLANNVEIVIKMLRDKRFDPNFLQIESFCSLTSIAMRQGNSETLNILLQDKRVDPNSTFFCLIDDRMAENRKAIWGAFKPYRHVKLQKKDDVEYWAAVDRLLLDERVDSMSGDMPKFFDIRMIRSRLLQTCIALQDLSLPALVTLEIVDALLPNSIPMYKKWDFIVAIKHFHD